MKKNHPNLYSDVAFYFEDEVKEKYPCLQESEKSRGRQGLRTCYATDDIEWLQKEHSWPGLKSIAVVETVRTFKGKTSKDRRFYLSSLPANPEQTCKTVRAHWSVENQCHWILDVIFNEDGSCIRNDNAAENMNMIRKWAMNIHNRFKKKHVSLKSMMRRSCMSIDFAKSLIYDYLRA